MRIKGPDSLLVTKDGPNHSIKVELVEKYWEIGSRP